MYITELMIFLELIFHNDIPYFLQLCFFCSFFFIWREEIIREKKFLRMGKIELLPMSETEHF